MESQRLRALYHKTVSYELRFWLYKVRNRQAVRDLRRRIFPSAKGDFSLRAFDRYQCLFIHITKSAGTSVAKSLFGELPYHYTAIQYRVIFGRHDFNRYYKFAFVRNPWDRLYSAYSYLKGGGWHDEDSAWYQENLAHLPDFNAFVLHWLEPHRLRSHLHLAPQSDFVCNGKGAPLLDYLGYFETLREDFAHVTQRLGIEAQLAHINASQRAGYRGVYAPEAIEKVGHLYHQDIANFGYDFQGVMDRKVVRLGKFTSAEE